VPVIADPESRRRARVSTQTLPSESGRRGRVSTRILLLACLPAVAVGLLVRVWLMRTSLAILNADEGITGLQAFEVLRGRFRLVVAGNDYGSTTETYLLAPFLAFWTGVGPMRILPIALSAVAAYALYRLARPIFGRVPAAALALIGWTISGGMVVMFMRAYMGYPTGFIAQVAALALACHAMRTEQKLARTAVFAGLAAGFATWSHPTFGTVALLALIAPALYRWRALIRWWLPLAAGGVLGVSPWLVYIAQTGWPGSAIPTVVTTYPERLTRFVTELLPRAFGLRTYWGDWVRPEALAIGVAALLIICSIVGMVVLVVLKGAPVLPILVAGVLAFPFLALFSPLGSVADARYAMPFLPQLLMGLGVWLLLIPERIRDSPWLVVTVPTMWAVLASVPVVHQQVGWQWRDPNTDAKQVVSELESRHIRYVTGDYWGAYLAGYLASGRLHAGTHGPVRLAEENATVNAADPSQVAYVYQDGMTPHLQMPVDRYQLVNVGAWDLYVPVGS
jgi:4-amino-4-deoxy-L-arabinose transferase-like glycosyltransferase